MANKFQIFGLILVVFGYSAIAATPAFAESEWLVNGSVISTELSIESSGLVSVDFLTLGILVVSVNCENGFDGTVGPGSSELITAILNSSKEEISGTPLVGLGLNCAIETSVDETCGKVGEQARLWPINLPWQAKIELSGTEFLGDLPTTSGYEVLCPPITIDLNEHEEFLEFLGSKENLCEGLKSALLTNEVGQVSETYSEATNEIFCTEGVGHMGGSRLIQLVNGETLSIS